MQMDKKKQMTPKKALAGGGRVVCMLERGAERCRKVANKLDAVKRGKLAERDNKRGGRETASTDAGGGPGKKEDRSKFKTNVSEVWANQKMGRAGKRLCSGRVGGGTFMERMGETPECRTNNEKSNVNGSQESDSSNRIEEKRETQKMRN